MNSGYQFDNVNLLSYEHHPSRFDAGGNWRIEKNFTINGTLTNFNNFYGVTGLLSGQESLLLSAQDYQPIVLNGVNFGNGQIKSVKFEDNTLVRLSKYTFEITAFDSGNLFNVLSGVYSGINWDSNTYLIDSFDESLSYAQETDLSKNYSHNINIRYNKQFPPLSGINLAVLFAKNLFNSESGIYPFLGQYQTLGNYKKLYTETYDLVTATCGFSAATKISPNNSGGFSYTLAYKLDLNQDGYTTITEDGAVQGEYSPRIQFAESGFSFLSGNSFNRANGVYNAYNFSTLPLFSGAIEQGVQKNNREGTVNFRNTFSNNPKYTGLAIWTYEDELTQTQEGYITIAEKGQVIGYGRPGIDKFSNANSFYSNFVVPTISGRLGTIYSGFTAYPKSLLQITATSTQDDFEGLIDYSSTETDNSTYVNISGIKSATIEIQINKPVHLFKNFSVFNVAEIVQSQYQNTPGSVAVNIRARGQRSLPLQSYINYSAAISNEWANIGVDNYLSNCKYSLSPITNDFSFNATFNFLSGYKAAFDLTLD